MPAELDVTQAPMRAAALGLVSVQGHTSQAFSPITQSCRRYHKSCVIAIGAAALCHGRREHRSFRWFTLLFCSLYLLTYKLVYLVFLEKRKKTWKCVRILTPIVWMSSKILLINPAVLKLCHVNDAQNDVLAADLPSHRTLFPGSPPEVEIWV